MKNVRAQPPSCFDQNERSEPAIAPNNWNRSISSHNRELYARFCICRSFQLRAVVLASRSKRAFPKRSDFRVPFPVSSPLRKGRYSNSTDFPLKKSVNVFRNREDRPIQRMSMLSEQTEKYFISSFQIWWCTKDGQTNPQCGVLILLVSLLNVIIQREKMDT